MQSMSLKVKVGADGQLNLQTPKQLANQELDLVIVYQPVKPENSTDIHEVVDSFYGCLADDTILVAEQNKQEVG
ncbi:MAG: hypothetical protein F6K10_06130 [Moorea sp. SIO2B7]|nr:hypothetical protein [Moorena sp. SIO2B7]